MLHLRKDNLPSIDMCFLIAANCALKLWDVIVCSFFLNIDKFSIKNKMRVSLNSTLQAQQWSWNHFGLYVLDDEKIQNLG